jgi:hypothetical protein
MKIGDKIRCSNSVATVVASGANGIFIGNNSGQLFEINGNWTVVPPCPFQIGDIVENGSVEAEIRMSPKNNLTPFAIRQNGCKVEGWWCHDTWSEWKKIEFKLRGVYNYQHSTSAFYVIEELPFKTQNWLRGEKNGSIVSHATTKDFHKVGDQRHFKTGTKIYFKNNPDSVERIAMYSVGDKVYYWCGNGISAGHHDTFTTVVHDYKVGDILHSDSDGQDYTIIALNPDGGYKLTWVNCPTGYICKINAAWKMKLVGFKGFPYKIGEKICLKNSPEWYEVISIKDAKKATLKNENGHEVEYWNPIVWEKYSEKKPKYTVSTKFQVGDKVQHLTSMQFYTVVAESDYKGAAPSYDEPIVFLIQDKYVCWGREGGLKKISQFAVGDKIQANYNKHNFATVVSREEYMEDIKKQGNYEPFVPENHVFFKDTLGYYGHDKETDHRKVKFIPGDVVTTGVSDYVVCSYEDAAKLGMRQAYSEKDIYVKQNNSAYWGFDSTFQLVTKKSLAEELFNAYDSDARKWDSLNEPYKAKWEKLATFVEKKYQK